MPTLRLQVHKVSRSVWVAMCCYVLCCVRVVQRVTILCVALAVFICLLLVPSQVVLDMLSVVGPRRRDDLDHLTTPR